MFDNKSKVLIGIQVSLISLPILLILKIHAITVCGLVFAIGIAIYNFLSWFEMTFLKYLSTMSLKIKVQHVNASDSPVYPFTEEFQSDAKPSTIN